MAKAKTKEPKPAKPKTPRKPAAVPHGTAKLIWAVEGERGILKINDTLYKIERILTGGPTPRYVWRLTKDADTVYDVHHDATHGEQCTCPHFVARQSRAGLPCKHISALRATKLVADVAELTK